MEKILTVICPPLIIAGGAMIGAQYKSGPLNAQNLPVYAGFSFIILGLVIYVIVALSNKSKQANLQSQIDELKKNQPSPSRADLASIITN